MSKKLNIAKNYLYNLSYQILALITPLVTTPYISRVIGEEGIGIYSYAFSITSYFAILAALGINTYGKLQVAVARNNKGEISSLFWEIFVARLFTAAVSIFLYGIFVILLGKQYKTMFIILGINLLAVATDITWFFQGLEVFNITVIKDFVIKLASIICIFLFVKTHSDLYKYAIIMQGSYFLGFAVLWINVKDKIVRKKIHIKGVIRHWTKCWVYFIPTLANTLYFYIDKTMIGTLVNASENGYYEQALKIQQVAMSVVTSVATVSLPRMAYLFKKQVQSEIQKYLKFCVSFVLMLSIPMTVGLIVIADVLVPWFLGPTFEKSINLLKILSLLVLVSGLGTTIGEMVVIPSGKQKQYNYARICGLLVNIGLNFLMIRNCGASGAAAASVISEFVVLVAFFLASRDYISIKAFWSSIVKFIISTCFMAVVVSEIKNILFNSEFCRLFVMIVLGVGVYFIGLFILQDETFNYLLKIGRNKLKMKKRE